MKVQALKPPMQPRPRCGRFADLRIACRMRRDLSDIAPIPARTDRKRVHGRRIEDCPPTIPTDAIVENVTQERLFRSEMSKLTSRLKANSAPSSSPGAGGTGSERWIIEIAAAS